MALLRLIPSLPALLLLGAALPGGMAHDGPGEPPHAPRGKVALPFLPPPMEGRLSLGIYAPGGRLLRTVASAEPVEGEAFDQEADRLVAWWDGLDDAGRPLPPGAYQARGYCIGDLAVEGVASAGNGWAENAPRVARLLGFGREPSGAIYAECADPSGASGKLPLGEPPPAPPAPGHGASVTPEGQLEIRPAGQPPVRPLEGTADRALDASPGAEGVTWAIVESAGARELRAYGPDGAFLRRLAASPGGPAMARVIAPPDRPEVYLIEENGEGQRLRGLRPGAPDPSAAAEGASVWEEFFDRSIRFTPTPESARPLLDELFPGRIEIAGGIALALLPNPLIQDAPGRAEIVAAITPEGSRIALADGLPLAEIGATPHLKWAALAREPGKKRILLIQSDGAVLEVFELLRPANMMAFDVGEITLATSSEGTADPPSER